MTSFGFPKVKWLQYAGEAIGIIFSRDLTQ